MNLIEAMKQRQNDTRAETARVYRDLLLRLNDPQNGDVDRLQGCMSALGRTADNLDRDAEVVREWQQYEEASAAIGGLVEAMSVANKHLAETEAHAQTQREALAAKLVEKLEPIRKAANAARAELSTAQHVVRELEHAAREWSEITGAA